MKAMVEGGEVIEALRDRILGRVAGQDIVNPETQETLYEAGTLLDEDMVEEIERMGIDEVKVRTPLNCDTRYGLCAACYGRDLGRGSLVNAGEAVGVVAAQSIGEPGTQLTMRTFHIGGAASRAAVASSVEAKSNGTVRFTATMRYVTNGKGAQIVISRSGEVLITDDHGRERERHKVPYGATLAVHHPLRKRGRGRHRRSPGGRSDRSVDPGGDRSEAPRFGQDPASAGQAAERRRTRSEDRRHRTRRDDRFPGRCADHGEGRPAGVGG
jgi:DNA-directed RNA polymerase subunit beta'